MKTARQIAYDILLKIYKDKGYSNISLAKILRENDTDKRDTAFITNLCYGTLEYTIQFDKIIKNYTKGKRIDLEIMIILRMGIYQLLYMDSVPDNAAVNETVKLVPYARKTSAKGMVNAVLRSFVRDEKQYACPSYKENPKEYCCYKFSCPEWLYDMWEKQYGSETAYKLCEATVSKGDVVVRVNTLKTTADELTALLDKRGISCEKSSLAENCLTLKNTGDIDSIEEFQNGLFYPQDTSSQLCAKALSAKEGMTVIDMCSAPGSKAFTVSQFMKNEGEILSFDVFEHKLRLIEKSAKRLGITIISTGLRDGTKKYDDVKQADRVLCDVPCSGLGIIKRKPEIKLKSYGELATLPKTQLQILENGAQYLKSGGILVYSTCTINKNENENVVNEFLNKNNSFKPLQLSELLGKIKGIENFFVTLMPHINNTDGFFISVLQKI